MLRATAIPASARDWMVLISQENFDGSWALMKIGHLDHSQDPARNGRSTMSFLCEGIAVSFNGELECHETKQEDSQ